MAGIGAGPLAGFLLEEVVGWMLMDSGYRLLSSASQDPVELVDGSNGLRVRGRGAEHQADALGELSYVPPFSLPLRMFVEAKCWKTKKVDLEAVRNAHGVVHDVNQNWASSAKRFAPRSRYHYLYSLFSTSGFTIDAQEYALAHQIVLVDLSTSDVSELREVLTNTADALIELLKSPHYSDVTVTAIRRALRNLLGTEPQSTDVTLGADLSARLGDLSMYVVGEWRTRILLGFPAAPFVLALTTTDIGQVIDSFRSNPVQRVRLRQTSRGEAAGTWVAQSEDRRIDLRFNLPSRIEEWISQDSGESVPRRSVLRNDFLSDITIIYSQGDQTTLFKLLYEPVDWRREA